MDNPFDDLVIPDAAAVDAVHSQRAKSSVRPATTSVAGPLSGPPAASVAADGPRADPVSSASASSSRGSDAAVGPGAAQPPASAAVLAPFAGAAPPSGAYAGDRGAHAILVNEKQRGNPMIPFIRLARLEYCKIVPDYEPCKGVALLFLSLKYHALHSTYMYKRMKEIRAEYRLRVLLVYCDLADVEKLLLDVNRVALLCGFTLVCAASLPECARYLETYRAYAHRSAAGIQERVEDAYLPRVTELLTGIRSINRSDVLVLLSRFGSVAAVMGASLAELQLCPGIADKKARRIYDAFHQPLCPAGNLLASAAAATRGGGGSAPGQPTGSPPADDDADADGIEVT